MRVFTHAAADDIRRAYGRSDEVLLSARKFTWFEYASVGLDGIDMWIPFDVFCAAVNLKLEELLPIFWESDRDFPKRKLEWDDLRAIRIDETEKFHALAKLLTRPLHVRREDGATGKHSSYIRVWPEGTVDHLWARERVTAALTYTVRPSPEKSLQTLLDEGVAEGAFACRFALDDNDLWRQAPPDGSEVTIRLLCLNQRGEQVANNSFGEKEWEKFGVRPATPREFVTLASQEGIALLDQLNGVVMCPTVWVLPNCSDPVLPRDYDRYVLEWLRRHGKAAIVPQNVITTYDCPVYWAVVEI